MLLSNSPTIIIDETKLRGAGIYMSIKVQIFAPGFIFAILINPFATCAMAQPTDSSQFAQDISVLAPKIDPVLVEIDLRLQASRLQELNKLRLLTEVLKIRIEQAVSGETMLRHSESRVRSGVGRGVDLEIASAYFSEANVNWREAYLNRINATQIVREKYGDIGSGDLVFEIYVPFSEKELIDFSGASGVSLAAQSWTRYRMVDELVLYNNMRVVSLGKVLAAYKQQFDIGQRTLLDFINTEREYSEARILLAETQARYRSSKINLNLLVGRLSYVPGGVDFDSDYWVDLDEGIHLIERRIFNLVRRISGAPLSPGRDLIGALMPESGFDIGGAKKLAELSGELDEVVDGLVVGYRRKVVKIEGKAMLRNPSGKMKRINLGDYIPPYGVVIMWPGTKISAGRAEESLENVGAGLSGGEPGGLKWKPNGFSCAKLLKDKSPFPIFPWPPWPPTDEHGLDSGARRSLGDVADYLSKALDQVGYANHYAFAAIPGSDGASFVGFAIVADPEQILPDGRAVPAAGRWQARLPRAGEVDLLSFIRGLVVAPEGRYRVMTFVVTDTPRNRSMTNLSDDSALRMFARCGPTQLTDTTVEMSLLRARPVTARTEIRVLVYEFTKQAEQQPARFLKPGLSAQQHLEQAGIMTALVSRP